MSNEPRPYDLSDFKERHRLISEVTGYMRVNLSVGTDWPGRAHAYHALYELEKGIKDGKFAVVEIVEKVAPPFVFDDEAP